MGEQIGLIVRKQEANSTPTIMPSDINTVGMLLDCKRGPLGIPILVTNLTDAEVAFGGPDNSKFGYYALKGLFENCKEYGAKVYGVRIGGSSPAGTAASYSLLETAAPVVTLTAAYKNNADVGTWGNSLKVKVSMSYPGFTLQVLLNDKLVETWENITLDVIESKLNNVGTGSRYVRASAVIANPGAHMPDEGTFTLIGGVDPGASVLGDWGATALAVFDNYPVDIVSFAGPFQGDSLTANLDTYCAGRGGDAIGIGCSAYSEDADTVMVTPSASGVSAHYLGWLLVDNGSGGTIWVPPNGHVIGAGYIRKPMDRGGWPFIAPAGYQANIRGIYKVQYPGIDPAKLELMVHTFRVNAIMNIPGKGNIIRTSCSTNESNKWYSIHTIRLAAYLIKTFKNNCGWVEQEPNDDITRGRLRDSIIFFMNRLRDASGFDRHGSLGDNGFLVKCDTENNPAEIRNSRQLVCDVLFDPVEVAETVKINLFNAKGLQITVE